MISSITCLSLTYFTALRHSFPHSPGLSLGVLDSVGLRWGQESTDLPDTLGDCSGQNSVLTQFWVPTVLGTLVYECFSLGVQAPA